MAEDHYSKAVCDQRHGDLERRMDALEHTVHGNGRPSLPAQIEGLRTQLATGMWGLGIVLGLLQLLVAVAMILIQNHHQ